MCNQQYSLCCKSLSLSNVRPNDRLVQICHLFVNYQSLKSWSCDNGFWTVLLRLGRRHVENSQSNEESHVHKQQPVASLVSRLRIYKKDTPIHYEAVVSGKKYSPNTKLILFQTNYEISTKLWAHDSCISETSESSSVGEYLLRLASVQDDPTCRHFHCCDCRVFTNIQKHQLFFKSNSSVYEAFEIKCSLESCACVFKLRTDSTYNQESIIQWRQAFNLIQIAHDFMQEQATIPEHAHSAASAWYHCIVHDSP
jgi:hypothetical protein